jgi:hypothetical protein
MKVIHVISSRTNIHALLPIVATLSVACTHTTPPREPNLANCPVTPADIDNGYRFGNSELEVGLPPDGKFLFEPGGPGFVAVSDGALGMKVGWDRLIPGRLTIEGRRLDSPAGPIRAHIPSMGRDKGFQATSVIFPTTGCWEVTGGLNNSSLTFVVLVEKVGDGPNWRRDL